MDTLTHAVMGAALASGVVSLRHRGQESALALRRSAAIAGAVPFILLLLVMVLVGGASSAIGRAGEQAPGGATRGSSCGRRPKAFRGLR